MPQNRNFIVSNFRVYTLSFLPISEAPAPAILIVELNSPHRNQPRPSQNRIFLDRLTVMTLSEQDKKFLAVAISEAQAGFDEGGIPIGASLVSKGGKLIAQGRNLRMQK